MGVAEAFALGMAMVNFGLKAMKAANSGNLDEAKQALKEAREHFDAALAGWETAPGPKD